MKYVHYESSTGRVLGWYSEEIHGNNIPDPGVVVTSEAWEEAISLGLNHVNPGSGKLSLKDFRTPQEVVSTEKGAKQREIDRDFLDSSKSFLTQGIQIDSDPISILNLNLSLSMTKLHGEEVTFIRDTNNIPHQVSVQTLEQIVLDLWVHSQDVLERKWAAQDSLENASDIAQVRQVRY